MPQPPTPPPLPPACADCVTVSKPALPGGAPQQYASRITRAGDGKMRVDTGNMSVITDPAKQETILLDHVKKTAQVFPMPQLPPPPPGMPQPGMPAMPTAPPPPNVHVQDLGKALIEGHEVDGKRYILTPPAMPQAPGMPQMPGVPKPPVPGMPQMPAPPAVPQAPTVSEVWTSSKLKMPVLTKTTGPAGEQVVHCRCQDAGEPPATAFQIPADYKPAVTVPQIPKAK